MKKILATTFYTTILLSAHGGEIAKKAAPPTSDSMSSGPVQFELIDFKKSQKNIEYGVTSYDGTGTIYTRDPKITNSTNIIVVRYKNLDNEDIFNSFVITNGVASLNIFSYGHEQANDKSPEVFSDLEIVGYYKLNPIQLVTNKSEFSHNQESEKIPTINLQNFKIKSNFDKYTKLITAHGNITTTSEHMKYGNYYTWINVNRSYITPSNITNKIVIEDGHGIFDIYDELYESNSTGKAPKFSDWHSFGYYSCTPAKIIENSAAIELSKNETIPSFELRTFGENQISENSVGFTAKNQAAVLTKYPAFSKGSYHLILSANHTQYNNAKSSHFVIIRDGLGTLRTETFFRHKEQKDQIFFNNWKTSCLIKLEPGSLVKINNLDHHQHEKIN